MDKRYNDYNVLALFNLLRVATHSLSWQLYRIKFKLFPVENIWQYHIMLIVNTATRQAPTFRPNSSLTKLGSISFRNLNFFSHSCCPLTSSSSCETMTPAPPSKPSSPDKLTAGGAYCTPTSLGFAATKNSPYGSCRSPVNSHFWSVSKNGFDIYHLSLFVNPNAMTITTRCGLHPREAYP